MASLMVAKWISQPIWIILRWMACNSVAINSKTFTIWSQYDNVALFLHDSNSSKSKWFSKDNTIWIYAMEIYETTMEAIHLMRQTPLLPESRYDSGRETGSGTRFTSVKVLRRERKILGRDFVLRHNLFQIEIQFGIDYFLTLIFFMRF